MRGAREHRKRLPDLTVSMCTHARIAGRRSSGDPAYPRRFPGSIGRARCQYPSSCPSWVPRSPPPSHPFSSRRARVRVRVSMRVSTRVCGAQPNDAVPANARGGGRRGRGGGAGFVCFDLLCCCVLLAICSRFDYVRS